MSLDWTHEFCLACDKQTDGTTYCSESCRLADYEKNSSAPSSGPSSPVLSAPITPWSCPKSTLSASVAMSPKFYLSPAYDFSNAQPYSRSTARPVSYASSRTESPATSPTVGRSLSPSTSHTSLCSMNSTSSAGGEIVQLSDKAARELRAYARSFDSTRLQRRRSY